MADVGTWLSDHIVLNNVTFTGNIDLRTPTSGKKLVISGWDLQTAGHTGGTCRMTILTGSTEHASRLTPAAPATAATHGNANPWTHLGIRLSGAVDEVLKINGGATSGTISGIVYVQEM
jgi:hypothetical protein